MARSSTTIKANLITAWLEQAGAGPTAARRAGEAIATAWANREFWWSATAAPLTTCRDASPALRTPVPELVRHISRQFGVHVHPVPAWEPQGARRETRHP